MVRSVISEVLVLLACQLGVKLLPPFFFVAFDFGPRPALPMGETELEDDLPLVSHYRHLLVWSSRSVFRTHSLH